jgi:hypothetical protein
MPQTTKGAVGNGDPTPGPAPRLDATDKKIQKALDMDDETWNRVVQQASSMSKTPAEVIAMTMRNALGAERPVGTWHSGLPGDPSLTEN